MLSLYRLTGECAAQKLKNLLQFWSMLMFMCIAIHQVALITVPVICAELSWYSTCADPEGVIGGLKPSPPPLGDLSRWRACSVLMKQKIFRRKCTPKCTNWSLQLQKFLGNCLNPIHARGVKPMLGQRRRQ